MTDELPDFDPLAFLPDDGEDEEYDDLLCEDGFPDEPPADLGNFGSSARREQKLAEAYDDTWADPTALELRAVILHELIRLFTNAAEACFGTILAEAAKDSPCDPANMTAVREAARAGIRECSRAASRVQADDAYFARADAEQARRLRGIHARHYPRSPRYWEEGANV
ncbi:MULTISPECIES: hypothetical protein [Thalassospira]|uniref:hypothetical protein n=1 Tax=Thalassospira TaxID=168934 RepID=UPI0008DD74CB|nr:MULTISPECIES: hypothetical protein [Thalassospira]MDM7975400.1 hypothetical protein [Thalassospira xiamenensis]OHZ00831.1 hypothetical protein BC440_08225 [Thalassospira sp. MIT1004]